ncbi:DNA polymerase III subunit delta [Prochlorococcus marinus]|uniref:DNA polymerase III subunit delta n=1 Tax=Prochlorococcus marinus (strain MIT 9211) TaxID=93059 RepID=A9BD91_PROM4|nr:DNA polymerase III subunit delta [Prochlorococcus marinus]ABX09704.1 DNA polymerase III, delta subunit [Prochlorococcus marinus str. MIT 9211]
MPIHLIWGDDYGSSERVIENLIKEIIDPAWISVNLSRLDGKDLSQANQALEEIQTPPFGSGGRVILVKRSPFCNGCSAELASKLEISLKQIPLTTHLILNNTNKPDKRLKTTKLLQELIKSNQASEKKFLLPAVWDGAGLKALVQKTAKELNLELEEEAILLLIESIGNDSTRLISELKKLTLLESTKNKNAHAHDILQISRETVHDLIQGISTNSLEIGNCLLKSQWGEAIAKLDALIDNGEPALRIIATLTGQIRGWLWVSLLEQHGQKDVGFIAKQAGISNPKRIYVIRKQIQGKSTIFFIDLLRKILGVEVLLKKGSFPKNAFRDGLLTKG